MSAIWIIVSSAKACCLFGEKLIPLNHNLNQCWHLPTASFWTKRSQHWITIQIFSNRNIHLKMSENRWPNAKEMKLHRSNISFTLSHWNGSHFTWASVCWSFIYCCVTGQQAWGTCPVVHLVHQSKSQLDVPKASQSQCPVVTCDLCCQIHGPPRATHCLSGEGPCQ